VVFAQLDLDVGPENVTKTAHEMGITAPLESVPAEAIGGLRVGVTPLEMANGYGTLAGGGVHHAATAVGRVEFPGGKVVQVNPESGDRVLTEGQAYDVTKLLEGVITQGTGAGYTYMGCPSEAGKTGTSEGESDAWFVGYTPMYSTAVWVGHPESRELTGFGGPTAGPIWRSFMERAQGGNCPEFSVPSELPSLAALSGGHTSSASAAYSHGTTETTESPEHPGHKPKGAPEHAPNPPSTPKPSPPPASHPSPSPPSNGAGGGVAAH
jgi:penicillin-binding protein 1A